MARAARPQHRHTVIEAYQTHVRRGLLKRDANQLRLLEQLDRLHFELATSDDDARVGETVPLPIDAVSVRFSSAPLKDSVALLATQAQRHLQLFLQPAAPRGLYISGNVGVGKSMCMDLFFEHADKATARRKRRRVHFHQFMLEVHASIHSFKQEHPRGDALPPLARALAQEAQLLCFDEFQVTDVADAMILKRLFSLLFDCGVVLVATSNRPPEALYDGGINRSLFLPFVALLRERCDVHDMDAEHDFRQDKAAATLQTPNATASYWHGHDAATTHAALSRVFATADPTDVGGPESLPVMMGRSLHVPRANARCCWFDFSSLCGRPLGSADYLALAQRFAVVIVQDVPQLDGDRYSEARRFVTLIDALYEARARLVLSADVPVSELFVEFAAEATTNDGDEEMQGEANEELWVAGVGGSSAQRSTTMIGKTEWSATGRVGVSLAQLSAVREVAFSFRRAASRLVEMQADDWGKDNNEGGILV